MDFVKVVKVFAPLCVISVVFNSHVDVVDQHGCVVQVIAEILCYAGCVGNFALSVLVDLISIIIILVIIVREVAQSYAFRDVEIAVGVKGLA